MMLFRSSSNSLYHFFCIWKEEHGRAGKEEEEEKSSDIRKENKGHRGILSRVTVKKKVELKLNFFFQVTSPSNLLCLFPDAKEMI